MSGPEVPDAGTVRAAESPREPVHDPVPEQTADDTDAGWGEVNRRVGDPHEEWLLEQRPPHWD